MAETSYREIVRVFGKIGLLSFGGPAAQIALMHKTLVDEQKWMSEKDLLSGLSFCMLLPGPEAMQLATYAGWRLRGTLGGLIAGTLFVLPGACVIMVLAALYVSFGQVPLVQTLFTGVKAAVLAIVAQALIKLMGRAVTTALHRTLAVLSFTALFVFNIPFPLVIGCAAAIGFALSERRTGHAAITRPAHNPLPTIAIGLALWWIPVLALWLPGTQALLAQLALFFSKLAAVTFGGAYAVLAYMVLVTQFVGFLAGFAAGGWSLAVAAALVALWVTFVPCFLWIFAGAPYIDWLSAQPRLNAAMAAITASVVGVIANLSLWFGMNVLFGTVSRGALGWEPELITFDVNAAVLTCAAGVMLIGLKWQVLWTLSATALLALALEFAF